VAETKESEKKERKREGKQKRGKRLRRHKAKLKCIIYLQGAEDSEKQMISLKEDFFYTDIPLRRECGSRKKMSSKRFTRRGGKKRMRRISGSPRQGGKKRIRIQKKIGSKRHWWGMGEPMARATLEEKKVKRKNLIETTRD